MLGSVSGSARCSGACSRPRSPSEPHSLDSAANTSPAPCVLTGGAGARGARRICSQVVDTNIRKLPRLAEVVLPDLAITGTASETFAVKVVGYGAGLALLGPVLWAAMGVVGVHLGFELPGVAVLVLGAAGVVTPFVDLHTAAQRRRRHFCHSLSTYASLVSMAMAGRDGLVERPGGRRRRVAPATGP